jgi:hypothetical protein
MLAKCTGDTGLDGLASMLEGGCLGRGVLWVGASDGTAVGGLQRGRRRREGGPGAVFFSSHVARLGSGQRELGSTAGVSRSMATGFERARTVKLTVLLIFADFRLPGVRRNARKKFKFEILKFFTLGDQHIDQGFHSYFCYKEMSSFAEILFPIFGIVTVSDSKFG